MKNLDSAEHLDRKLDESRQENSGHKAVGIDVFIVPIRSELYGAQIILAQDRRKLLEILFKREKQEIEKELAARYLDLYKD